MQAVENEVEVMQASRLPALGKFVLEKTWADSFIVCPRGLASAWAVRTGNGAAVGPRRPTPRGYNKRAHPTFFDSFSEVNPRLFRGTYAREGVPFAGCKSLSELATAP